MNTTASDIFNAHEIKELRQAGMKRIGNCLNDMFPVEDLPQPSYDLIYAIQDLSNKSDIDTDSKPDDKPILL